MRKLFKAEINLAEENESLTSDFDEDIALAENILGQCKSESQEVVSIELHVLYNLSYGVPWICFNVHKSSKHIKVSILIDRITRFYVSDGSLLSLDEAWRMFDDPIQGKDAYKTLPMTKILTQMEHPIQFKPYLALHPCQTAELLSNFPSSKNKVLSFLSSIAPAINLSFDLRYANINNVNTYIDSR